MQLLFPVEWIAERKVATRLRINFTNRFLHAGCNGQRNIYWLGLILALSEFSGLEKL